MAVMELLVLFLVGLATTATATVWVQLGGDIEGEGASDNAGSANAISLSANGSRVAMGA